MGAIQPTENIDSLLDNYTTVFEQNGFKLLQQKTTRDTFILKEQSFLKKNQYELAFKKITQRQKKQHNDNVLQLVKFWSKEHNGICSNLFKIYTVYEYPKVKLIDQIQARKRQHQYFDELELFSILQSCLSAIKEDPIFINISPHLIFVLQEGVLKLTHSDLLNPDYRRVYNEQYYYSPQKIDDFTKDDESSEDIQKETVFSLGMTILHSALLKTPIHCYEISMKNFNEKKLNILLQQLQRRYSSTLINVIKQMVQIDPSKRASYNDIEDLTTSFFDNHSQTLVNSFSEVPKIQNLQTNSHPHFTTNHDEASLIYSGETFQKNKAFLQLPSVNDSLWKKGEFEIVFDQSQRQSLSLLKEANNLQKTKKYSCNEIANKQNIFTDPEIMKMIKNGVDKINKSNNHQKIEDLKGVTSCKSILNSNISPQLADYSIVDSRKAKCTFVVQSYADNSAYEGMMMDGMKNGYGKLTYEDGVYYQGNFKNDTLQGKGSLFYGPNRPAYIGQWLNNKFHGIGILYNEHPSPIQLSFDYKNFNKIADYWIKFEGHFKEDFKQGPGKIILTNGQIIQTTFSKGLMNGEGIFTDIDGKQTKGKWSDNIFIQ